MRLGIVNHVVAPGELDEFVTSYAKTMAGNAPLSLIAAKRVVDELIKDAERRDRALCDKVVADCFGSTVGHLSPAFRRLFEQGMMTTTGSTKHLTPRKKIFPTVLALQGLPELAGSTEAELHDQLLKLRR